MYDSLCCFSVCVHLQWHCLPLRLDQEGSSGARAGLPGVSGPLQMAVEQQPVLRASTGHRLVASTGRF